jgi:hypothetical protein
MELFIFLAISVTAIHAIIVNDSLFLNFNGMQKSVFLKGIQKPVAVAYLMTERDPLLFRWASHLVSQNTTVFVFTDRPEVNHISITRRNIVVVSISSDLCKSFGYSHFGTFAYIQKPVTCWDKVLFFFSKVATQFRFVWMMETDVFIPTLGAFTHLNNVAMKNTSADLIISSILYEDNDLNQWHWRALQPIMVPTPWYHSMACVMGLSRKMIYILDDYVQKYGRLHFLEYLPLTLAVHNNLSIFLPHEFSTITWANTFTCEDILHQSSNWFHPIKRIAEFIGNCLEGGEWPLEILQLRGLR